MNKIFSITEKAFQGIKVYLPPPPSSHPQKEVIEAATEEAHVKEPRDIYEC
jgi:hypothetical protein